MKLVLEFIPKLNFLKVAEETKDLVDGWNVTDSAGGRPAPSGTAVACVLKAKYPEKIVIPMLITNYKGPVEIGAVALAAEAMGIYGMVPDPGDPPIYGHPIKTVNDGSCQLLVDDNEISTFRRSTGAAENVRSFLKNSVQIKNLKFGCLLTARRPVEDAIARIRDDWDFGFFMRLEEKSLPMLRELSGECKKLNKPLYAYLIVETAKNKKIIERIGWPSTTTLDKVEDFMPNLVGVLDGVIPTCLGDSAGEIELLKKLQAFRDTAC